jgi:hypothetical protein
VVVMVVCGEKHKFIPFFANGFALGEWFLRRTIPFILISPMEDL